MNPTSRQFLITFLERLHLLSFARGVKCYLEHMADARHDVKHIGGISEKTQGFRLAALSLLHHKIEKGLCMPNFRPKFGQDTVAQTIRMVKELLNNGTPAETAEIQAALSALHEYQEMHQRLGVELPTPLAEDLSAVIHETEHSVTHQWEMTPQRLWGKSEAPFPTFAASRHSVRNFCGKADSTLIDKAIALACTAPTACNRQHVRVHTYEDAKATALIAYQNGNRGFGHLCQQLIVITTDKNALFSPNERHDAYTNGGIFAMNLSYSLHYYHVAHCMLNWSTDPKTDKAFKKIAEIPDNEAVVLLIACGQVPETFKVTQSPRKNVTQIHTKH